MTKGDALLKPLGGGECFLLDFEGRKTVAVKLPANVASEISGQALLISEGFFAKLKSKLGLTPEAESWLAVTSVDNPLLEQLDRFKTLLVEQLADATGKPITKTDVAVSAGVPVNEEERTNVALKQDAGMRYHAPRN